MEELESLDQLIQQLVDNWPVFRAVVAVVIGGCIAGILYMKNTVDARQTDSGTFVVCMLGGFVVGVVVYVYMIIALVVFLVVVSLIATCRMLPIIAGNLFHAKARLRGDHRPPQFSPAEQELIMQMALQRLMSEMAHGGQLSMSQPTQTSALPQQDSCLPASGNTQEATAREEITRQVREEQERFQYPDDLAVQEIETRMQRWRESRTFAL